MADDQQPPSDEQPDAPEELTPQQRAAANAAWARSDARHKRMGKESPPMPFPPPEAAEGAPEQPQRDFTETPGRRIEHPDAPGGMQFFDRVNEPPPPAPPPPPPEPEPEPTPEPPPKAEYPSGNQSQVWGTESQPFGPDPFEPVSEPPDPFDDEPEQAPPSRRGGPPPGVIDPRTPEVPTFRDEQGGEPSSGGTEKQTELLRDILTTLERIAESIKNVGSFV